MARAPHASLNGARRNFVAHVVEGGLYIGGLSFVHASTVLPRLLEEQGASALMIAFAPTLLGIGFIAPGLLVAHRIEQLPHMRGWVLTLGVWQRLVYLAAAALLWGLGAERGWVIATLLGAPLLSGLVGGVAVNAWKEYVASAIPEEQRASLWAARYVLGTLLGFLAGKGVTRVLEAEGGPRGYAVLHAAAFACLAASFVVFCFTREGSHAPRGQLRSLAGLLREAPALARSSRSFWRYLWARIPLHGIYVLIPFLGNHALARLHQPDAYLGTLLGYHLVGSLAGYFAAGYSGDRHGGRLSLLAAHVCWLVVAVAAPFAGSEMAFQALFGLLGAGLSMSTVALSTLDLEITPTGQRVALQAVLGVFTLLGLTSASLLAATLRGLGSSLWMLSGPTLALVCVSGTLMLAVQEPRASRESVVTPPS